MQLIDLGWDSSFDKSFESFNDRNLSPARIARENRNNYLTLSSDGELVGELSGKFHNETNGSAGRPAIGDWVTISPRPNEGRATIHALFPRKSAFVRKVAGMITEAQIVAANIDTVFIVCGLDNNFNPRRVERYLALAWESGATPVVILNKVDLCDDAESLVAEIESIAIGVPVHPISAVAGTGLAVFSDYLTTGKTAAFLGSSGVGKSTIINSLLGAERLKVGEVREYDGRGRHTTSFRELILLPGGGIVIDTPGMREIQVWGDDEGLKQAFDDIQALALQCRFTDCNHHTEPGCAVKKAVLDGTLDPDRLRSYMKLKRELQYLAARQSFKASIIEKNRWKKISQYQKSLKKKGH